MSGSTFAPQISLNPIQWMATDDGWLDLQLAPERHDLLSQVKNAGFNAVMADVPVGWTVGRYRDVLAELDLELAPGYFVCRSDGLDGLATDVLTNARTVAEQHAQLGLTDIGLGLNMNKEAPRLSHPGQGVAADPARLDALIALIARISDVMSSEGIRPALHPHIATWIETEDEGRAVLDSISAERLGFLPDTGHLAWAGADVRTFIADYADRVPFVHVKDCRLSVAERGRASSWDYQQTVTAGMWVEPGRGELPLREYIDALPRNFTGSLMVEVDRPDITDPYESAKAAATWMHDAFGSGQ